MENYSEYPSDAAAVFPIWSGSGIPAGSEEWGWHEQTRQMPQTPDAPSMQAVRNVVIPTLTMFRPTEEAANGTALIVAPGGAFHFLAIDHEGYDVARWVTQFGVTAFVLKYRLHHTPEDNADLLAFLEGFGESLPDVAQAEIDPPIGFASMETIRLLAEEDGRQAIRFLRQNAAEMGVDPERIGIIGFSAGGGVAVNAALEYDELSRPNFAAGIYPGYRIVRPIPKDVPPLFIATADDDALVAPISAARLYEEWHKIGKMVELHIFTNGGHGFGMYQQQLLSDSWVDLFKRWMMAQGFIV